MIIDTANLDMEAIRAIRLRFYTAAMQCRGYASGLRQDGEKGSAKHYDKMADAHIKRVQALNDLFEIGDDAGSDYQRAEQ